MDSDANGSAKNSFSENSIQIKYMAYKPDNHDVLNVAQFPIAIQYDIKIDVLNIVEVFF